MGSAPKPPPTPSRGEVVQFSWKNGELGANTSRCQTERGCGPGTHVEALPTGWRGNYVPRA